jgi:hypothetical protein
MDTEDFKLGQTITFSRQAGIEQNKRILDQIRNSPVMTSFRINENEYHSQTRFNDGSLLYKSVSRVDENCIDWDERPLTGDEIIEFCKMIHNYVESLPVLVKALKRLSELEDENES